MRRLQWLRPEWLRQVCQRLGNWASIDAFIGVGRPRGRRRPVGLVPWSMPAVVERLEERRLLSCTNPPVAEAGGPYDVGEWGGAPDPGYLELNGSGSYATGSAGTSLDYAWDIDGDGQFDDAFGVSPSIHWSVLHDTYGYEGGDTFAVTLQVTDGDGCTDTDAAPVVMGTSLPLARITGGPQKVSYGGGLSLSGETSVDLDGGDITAYEWDLDGDGDYNDAIGDDISGEKGEFLQLDWDDLLTHSLTTGGTVRLRVTDNDGESQSTSFTFTVENQLVGRGSDNKDAECTCMCACPVPTKVDEADGALRTVVTTHWGFTSDPLFPLAVSVIDSHPVIEFDFALPAGERPVSLAATLTYNGSQAAAVPLDLPADWSSSSDLFSGRFALQYDASALSTGRYGYSVEVVATYADSSTETFTASGFDHLVNHSASEFGNRWLVRDLDRLLIGVDGVSHVRGNGTAGYFAEDGSGGFLTPEGTFSELVQNTDGTYTVWDHHNGGAIEFSAAGLMLERHSREGDSLSYQYVDADADGTADELAGVIDSVTGRTASYAYDAGGMIDAYTDFAGRVFDFTVSGGLVTAIDGPAPGTGDTVTFGYDATTKQMTQVTGPEGQATSITYGADLRVASVTHPGEAAVTYESQPSALLNTLTAAEAVYATRTTPDGTYQTRHDRYGYVVEEIDPHGNVTESERNADGQVLVMTVRDDQGTVLDRTTYEYDAHGRRLSVSYFDGTGESWTYEADPFLRRPKTHTDRAGQVTTYTIDAVSGLVERMTLPDPDGAANPLEAPIYDYEYDANGNLAKETGPDPDGVAGPLGRPETSYTYYTSGSEQGRLKTLTLPDPDGDGQQEVAAVFTYDYTFDAAGRLLTETETGPDPDGSGPLGQSVTVTEYDAAGRVITLTLPDPDGPTSPLLPPVSSYAYRDDGSLDTETDALGRVTDYEYDTAGRLWKAYRLDESGVNVLGAGVAVVTYTYDSSGRLASESDAEGNTTAYGYDHHGRVTSIEVTDANGVNPLGTDANSVGYKLTESAYDALGRLTTETDARGTVTEYHYSPGTGQLTSVSVRDKDGNNPLGQDALGNERVLASYTYDAFGRLASEADALGRTTGYGYDFLGRLTTLTDDLDRDTLYEYDAAGNLLSVERLDASGVNPLGTDGSGEGIKTARHEYDLLGRLTAEFDALGSQTHYDYDILGNLQSVERLDASGINPLPGAPKLVRSTYDGLSRLVSESDALGHVTDYAYDAAGNLLSVTGPELDPDGDGIFEIFERPVTQYRYDAFDRLTEVYDAHHDPQTDGPSEQFGYDDAGRLVSEWDALGRLTSTEYDALGRVTKVTLPDPDGPTSPDGLSGILESPVYTTAYATDRSGTLTEVDPLGYQTVSEHDVFGRLLSVERLDAAGTNPLGAGVPRMQFTYDAIGRLASEADGEGRVTSYAYGHDAAGRWRTVTTPDPDGAGSEEGAVWTSHFDALDRLGWEMVTGAATGVNPFGSGAKLASYTYKDDGQLASVTDELGRVTSYQYDALGRLQTTTLSDPDLGDAVAPPTLAYTYDALDRVVTETDQVGAVTEYVYDSYGRILTQTQPDPVTGAASGPVTQSRYDLLGRLTETTDAEGRTTSYEYDAVGNRTKILRPDPDGDGVDRPTEVYVYDELDRLTSASDPLGHVTRYTYDGLGQTLTQTVTPEAEVESVTTYVYDVFGQMASLTDPAGNATSWSYHGDGQVHTETTAFGTRTYLYDDAGRLASREDRNGRLIEYGYDLLGRKTLERWLAADGVTLADTLEWTYEGLDQVQTAGDGDSQYTYAYNDAGWLETVDNLGTPDMPRVVQSYEYDTRGLRTSADATIAGTADFSNTYAYDALGRMTRVEQSDGAPAAGSVVNDKHVELTYDALGRFETITRYEDLAGTELVATTSYGYDPHTGRLTDLDHVQGTTTLASYDWTYDDADRLTGESVSSTVAREVTADLADSGYLFSAVGDFDGDGADDLLVLHTDSTWWVALSSEDFNNQTQWGALGAGTWTAHLVGDFNGDGFDDVASFDNATAAWHVSLATDMGSDGIPDAFTTTIWADYAGSGWSSHLVGDFNGDGTSDLASFDGSTWWVARQDALDSDSDGNTAEVITSAWATTGGGWTAHVAGDFNGDGADDIASFYVYTDAWWVGLSHDGNGDGHIDGLDGFSTWADYADANYSHVLVGDYNGDGWDDIAAYQVDSLGHWHVSLASDSNSDGKTDGFSTSDWVLFYPASGWSAQAGDFNGDGADDLFSVGNNGTAWISTATDTTGGTDIDNVPDHFVNTQWTEWIGGQATWRVGDFNGDSRSDAGEVYDADTSAAVDHRWQAWLMNPRATSSYAYDDTDQLTAANHTGHTDQADEDYAYDENGNPTGTGYTIGTGNRILADATHDYAYDAEGNLTRETERASGNYRQYAYDHRNQLVAVSFYTAANVLTKKVEYDYDVSNRLIRRRVDETGDGVFDSAHRFVYDNAGKLDPATGVPLDDIALVFDETGSLTTRRLHGPAIDQVFADEDALGEILWSLTDRQGTVRDVADYDATTDITSIVNHLTYDSFGELTDQTDPSKSPLAKYTGRYTDPDTGLRNHLNRWTHPRLRRFTSRDHILSGPNLYEYAGNSPTNYTDPSGLKKAVYVSRGILPQKLTWELDSRERKKISEINESLEEAILLRCDLAGSLAAHRDEEEIFTDDEFSELQEEYENLKELIRFLQTYKEAILEFEPSHSRPANGAVLSFDFAAFEGTKSEAARQFDIFMDGFTAGLEVGLAEGANQQLVGFRRINRLRQIRKGWTPSKNGTLTNFETREWYHTQLDRIDTTIGKNWTSARKRQKAIEVFNERNRIRQKARDLMTDRKTAECLDQANPLPSLRDIVRRKYKEKGLSGDKLWEDIIGTSKKSRSSVDERFQLDRMHIEW